MADRYAGYLGDNAYSTPYNRKRAEERALARLNGPGGLDRIQGGEVLKPEPDPGWCLEAKEMWVLVSSDEASLYFGSGDWFTLKLACTLLHRALTDPRKHTPSAQAMTVIHDMLKDLKVTDTAKRQNGILVDRTDPDPLANLSHEERAALDAALGDDEAA